MDKRIRVVHLMLFAFAAVASLVVGVITGLSWAGSGVGVVMASRAVRSTLLLARPTDGEEGAQRISAVSQAHGIGCVIAAILFGASALRVETQWSGVIAVLLFVVGTMNLWLARRTRPGLSG